LNPDVQMLIGDASPVKQETLSIFVVLPKVQYREWRSYNKIPINPTTLGNIPPTNMKRL